MFDEFINKTLNRAIDVDGNYGPQCVDLFNYFNDLYNNGERINCLPTGYARSLAENKLNNGILENFVETTYDKLIKGTVVVYGKCKFAPEGHVCFFLEDNNDGTFKALQQNNMDRQYITIDDNPYSGIIGCFIPKQLLDKKEDVKPKFKIGDKVKSIKTGNASSHGDGWSAMSGCVGYISEYIENRPYPYLLSDHEGAVGWYTEDGLTLL